MSGKLTIMVGIPGSGKTHEAEFILHHEGRENVELVSRDDLRHLLFRSEGILTAGKELRITDIQKKIVKDALRMGKHVVVHDMNLRKRYQKMWAEIASNAGAEFRLVDMTYVPLETCLMRVEKRNALGGRYISLDVVKDIHKKFVKNQPAPVAPEIASKGLMDLVQYVPDLSKPAAIIVDLDGTTALCEGVRSPYDYSMVRFDKPNTPVINLVRDEAYHLGTKILFVSGRLAALGEDDQCYKDTEAWLNEHVKVPIELLAMRDRDKVDDTVIKYEIFNQYIRDFYNVKYALDDRNRVVKMWRSIGLYTNQVAEGDF